MSLPYLLTKGVLTVYVEGRPYSLEKDSELFSKAMVLIKEEKGKELLVLMDKGKALKEYSNSEIEILEGRISYKGVSIKTSLASYILRMKEEGFDCSNFLKFLDNLMLNPSNSVVSRLWDFLEVGKNPVTDDGCFLAYKKINNDWTDIYTGKMNNSVGQEVSVPRNFVDEDMNRTCSHGLHVCSYEYLSSYGNSNDNRVVICKVNPKDVVAIPRDYNDTKMRVCSYTVLEEVVDWKKNNVLTKSSVVITNSNEDYDDYDNYEEHDNLDWDYEDPYEDDCDDFDYDEDTSDEVSDEGKVYDVNMSFAKTQGWWSSGLLKEGVILCDVKPLENVLDKLEEVMTKELIELCSLRNLKKNPVSTIDRYLVIVPRDNKASKHILYAPRKSAF